MKKYKLLSLNIIIAIVHEKKIKNILFKMQISFPDKHARIVHIVERRLLFK